MKKLKNEELGRLSVEDYKTTEKLPIILVLDNIRSAHNVGAAFRTSDSFSIEGIYLCGITAKPPHREIHKAALGATETVNWEAFDNGIEAIEKLKKEGYTIISVEQADKSLMLQEFNPADYQKLALVFGNEVFGVDDNIIHQSDIVLEIPQFGTKHSLNVSVSMGIVLWDLVKKIKFE